MTVVPGPGQDFIPPTPVVVTPRPRGAGTRRWFSVVVNLVFGGR
jgi:hypothetical protein